MASLFNADQVSAVIFDLDDTLRHNQPHAHNFLSEYLLSLGLDLEENARQRSFRWGHQYWASSEELLADIKQHEGYEDPFWQNYTRRHLRAIGLSEQEIEQHAPQVHQHMRNKYRPESHVAPEVQETLRVLRSAGFFTGLVTNRTRPIHDEMLDLDLDHHLDFFLAAGQVGSFKPERELFDAVLKLIDFSAEETVYVGDNYYADIQGARNAGIQPVLYDPLKLYPDAEAPVIRTIPELLSLLEIEEEAEA